MRKHDSAGLMSLAALLWSVSLSFDGSQPPSRLKYVVFTRKLTSVLSPRIREHPHMYSRQSPG